MSNINESISDLNQKINEMAEKQKREIELKVKSMSETVSEAGGEMESNCQNKNTGKYVPSVYVKTLTVIAKINLALTGIFLIAAVVTRWSTQEMCLIAAVACLAGWLSGLITAHLLKLIEKCAFYLEASISKPS